MAFKLRNVWVLKILETLMISDLTEDNKFLPKRVAIP